jgi:hypothetical protein
VHHQEPDGETVAVTSITKVSSDREL